MNELIDKARKIYASILASSEEDEEYKMGVVETLDSLFGTETFKDIIEDDEV